MAITPPARTAERDDGDYILVVGNHFAHKRVPATVEALSLTFPDEKIVALGMSDVQRENVTWYPSGHLPEEDIDRLYREGPLSRVSVHL